MLIRRETPSDKDAIRAIHTAAFPGERPAEPDLVDQLRADGDLIGSLSILAINGDGEICGHACCSRASLDEAETGAIALGPLGVLPTRQGNGVGSALMHAALAAADALEVPAVVLLGEPRYYARFGFVLAERYGVAPPTSQWAPYFQLRALSAFHAGIRGEFRYSPAFDQL